MTRKIISGKPCTTVRVMEKAPMCQLKPICIVAARKQQDKLIECPSIENQHDFMLQNTVVQDHPAITDKAFGRTASSKPLGSHVACRHPVPANCIFSRYQIVENILIIHG